MELSLEEAFCSDWMLKDEERGSALTPAKFRDRNQDGSDSEVGFGCSLPPQQGAPLASALRSDVFSENAMFSAEP